MNFLIIGLDSTDEDAPARRQAVRPDHVAFGDKLKDAGNLWYASALFNDEGQMKGSMYFVDFKDEEELKQYLEQEPYVKGKVWQDITVHRAGVREPWQFNRQKEFFESRQG